MCHASGWCIKMEWFVWAITEKHEENGKMFRQFKMIKAYKIFCKYQVLERALIIILVQWMGPTISILSGYFNWQIEASL